MCISVNPRNCTYALPRRCISTFYTWTPCFSFDVEKKQDDHDNSRNDSKVGNATKEIFKISGGPQLRPNSNAAQIKPPAKSQSTPKKSKEDEDKTSPKPRKSKSHDEEKTKVSYYTTFPEQIRGEPAAVNVGVNAGLKNSNVYCYSNAILQCLASCIFSLISHQVKIIQSLH